MLVIPWAKTSSCPRRLPLRYLLATSYLLLFGLISLVFSLILYVGLSHTLWMLGLLRMEDNVHSLLSDIPAGLKCQCDEHSGESKGKLGKLGMLPICDDFEDLKNLRQEHLSSPFFSAAILDSDGRILKQSSSFQHSPSPIDPQRLEQLQAACEKVLSSPLTYSAPADELRLSWEDHQKREVLLVPLARKGQLVGFIQMRTTWAPAYWLLDRFLVLVTVGLVFTLATTIALSVAVARLWSRPLEVLAETARRVSSGDLSARTQLKPLAVEFCEVAATFDSMVDCLENMFAGQRRFVGDASHELKTPLAALEGQFHVIELLEMGDPNARRNQALQAAGRELRRMDRLVTDLLELSRAEHPSRKLIPFCLGEVLEDAIEAALGPNPDREIHRDPKAGQFDVMGEPESLSRSLRNLLENSLRHTPVEGRVELVIRLEEDCLKLIVTDDGGGILAQHLPRITERFYRVDEGRARAQGGTGLGLAIVKAVSEKHGGRLEMVSNEGLGTRATIVLPASLILPQSPPERRSDDNS